jgi:outer membrane protein assembly factor BamB
MKIGKLFIGIFLSTVILVGKGISFPQEIVPQGESVLRGARIAVAVMPSGETDRIYIGREHEIQCLDRSLSRVIWASPVVSGAVDVGPLLLGRTLVYVSGDMSTVKGLDVVDGSTKWSATIQSAHITGNGKIVFLATSTGMGVQALNAETGKRIWKYEPGGPGSISQLVYADGKIYTDSYVLNATNGQMIKKNPSTAKVINARADTVFKTIGDGRIESVRIRTNTAEWQVTSSQNIHPITMFANDQFLFFVGYNGMPFIARTGVLQAFDIADGHKAWELPIASATSNGGLQPDPIASDHDNVYLLTAGVDSGTRLSKISAATGKQIWSHDLKGKLEGPPLVVGGVLYLTDGPDVLYEIDKGSGRVLLRVELTKKQ